MFLLKKLLTAWLFPPAGLVLLSLLGLVLLIRRRIRLGVTCMLLGQGALLLLSLPVIASALIRSLEVYPAAAPAELATVQAVVILGGGTRYGAPEYGGEDTVTAATLERLRYGAKLAREYRLPLLVTGGAVYGGRPEAVSMQTVLTGEWGLPVRWVEDQARDTRENARLSARMLKAAGITRVALVSQAWHLPRAVPLFVAEGLTVVPAPTAFTESQPLLEAWLPSAEALRVSRQALHEWVGRFLA